MPSTPKLDTKSLPHVPGYTVWENANGLGRPGYLPGSGNQYVDIVDALGTASTQEARIIACAFLSFLGALYGFGLGDSLFGGRGAVIGIFMGIAGGLGVGYLLGLFLVRLAAALLVLVPIGFALWFAGSLLFDLWHR